MFPHPQAQLTSGIELSRRPRHCCESTSEADSTSRDHTSRRGTDHSELRWSGGTAPGWCHKPASRSGRQLDLTRTVTSGQLAVLRRIASGPPLTKSDSVLALSVYALRTRGLVSTPTQNGYTATTITDAGLHFLRTADAPPSPDRARRKPAAHSPRPTITAEELLSRLAAAGGELRISDPPADIRRAWRQAIHAASNRGLPDGYRIRHHGRDSGDLLIAVVPVDKPARPRTIVPPADMTKRHPGVRATKDAAGRKRTGWLDTNLLPGVVHVDIDRSQLERVLLVTQTLIAEAERRGYLVRFDRSVCGGLSFVVADQAIEITFYAEREATTTPAPSTHSGPQRYAVMPTGRLEVHRGHRGYGAPPGGRPQALDTRRPTRRRTPSGGRTSSGDQPTHG